MTTSERFNAAQIRSTYELRPAIEERHSQYKCFWDLTRMHSCAHWLKVNYRQRFCLLTLAEFGHILRDIADPARATLREKLKRSQHQQYPLRRSIGGAWEGRDDCV